MTPFLQRAALAIAVTLLGACSGGGDGGSGSSPAAAIVVNSLLDSAAPPAGTVTLRSALASAASGQTIEFDGTLSGGTIALSIVADEHTVLKGEVMGIRNEPSGPVSYLVGYFDRDYGRSALVARKDVVIDASKLPAGITIAWAGTTRAQTWPRELENHPYIHFWHRLDAALAQAGIPGMGPELLGDAAWQRLFSSGTLPETPGIRISVRAEQNLSVQRLSVDQLGTSRPSTGESDIGAIELR